MKERGTLYRWSKAIDDDQLDWWETELIGRGISYAAEKTTGRKRTRLTVYDPNRREVDALKQRYGGGVSRVRPEDWQESGNGDGKLLRIRDRLVVTQEADPEKWRELKAEFPCREVLSFPARLAFGTGDHPTTASCLRLLTDEANRFPAGDSWTILDLGCGSGILSVAAARLGARQALAIENDPVAVRIARENLQRHAAENVVELIAGDAIAWAARPKRGDGQVPSKGYSLIAANLFNDLLIAGLPHFGSLLHPDGAVILSGFLTSQAAGIDHAAKVSGLKLDRFIRRGKWVTAAGGHE